MFQSNYKSNRLSSALCTVETPNDRDPARNRSSHRVWLPCDGESRELRGGGPRPLAGPYVVVAADKIDIACSCDPCATVIGCTRAHVRT